MCRHNQSLPTEPNLRGGKGTPKGKGAVLIPVGLTPGLEHVSMVIIYDHHHNLDGYNMYVCMCGMA